MPEEKIKLTPMRLLALNMAYNKAVYPGQLAGKWAEINNVNLGVSSRRRFGATSASYKRLYELERLGFLYEFERDYCFGITEEGKAVFESAVLEHVIDYFDKNKSLHPLFAGIETESITMEFVKFFCKEPMDNGKCFVHYLINK